MALTLYERDAAELDKLLSELSATDPANGLAVQEKRQALLDFKGETTHSDLEDRADAAIKASINQAMSDFAAHFAAVAAQAEDVTSTFKAAVRLAAEGEDNLLVNRLNTHLERANKSLTAGKEFIETIKGLGKIDAAQAQESIAKIEAAYKAWEDLRSRLLTSPSEH